MKLLSPILIALSLTVILGGCASGESAPEKPATPAEAGDDEESEDRAGASTGGARVCGWSDTGRWVCSGGPAKKTGGALIIENPPKEKSSPTERKAKPAPKAPAKKSGSSGVGNSPKESEIVTDPIED